MHSLIVPMTAMTLFRVARRCELLTWKSARMYRLEPADCRNLLSHLHPRTSSLFFLRVLQNLRARTAACIDANGPSPLQPGAVNSLTFYSGSPSKKVIIFIRTGKCLTKRGARYCSDSSRSDCCFVSLTRNVCRVPGSRFSETWRCVIISDC